MNQSNLFIVVQFPLIGLIFLASLTSHALAGTRCELAVASSGISSTLSLIPAATALAGLPSKSSSKPTGELADLIDALAELHLHLSQMRRESSVYKQIKIEAEMTRREIFAIARQAGWSHSRTLRAIRQSVKGRSLGESAAKEREVERERTARDTETDHRFDNEMEFWPLFPGTFEVQRYNNREAFNERAEVTLTHAFEAMSTKVTQRQWVEIMGKNPSFHYNGEDSTFLTVNGQQVQLQPNHPVEQVNWWSVLVLANKLSEKRGLKPAYDLSQIQFSGNAEDGTLRYESGELKLHAPDNDIYQTEGYRLPTDAEAYFWMSNLGTVNGCYPFGNVTDLPQYAWYKENSQNGTHRVGSTPRSVVLDGHAFHDIIGNVAEWRYDCDSVYRVLSSGSFRDSDSLLAINMRFGLPPDHRNNFVGFRLVRTLKD